MSRCSPTTTCCVRCCRRLVADGCPEEGECIEFRVVGGRHGAHARRHGPDHCESHKTPFGNRCLVTATSPCARRFIFAVDAVSTLAARPGDEFEETGGFKIRPFLACQQFFLCNGSDAMVQSSEVLHTCTLHRQRSIPCPLPAQKTKRSRKRRWPCWTPRAR